jgi:hypothetical protein
MIYPCECGHEKADHANVGRGWCNGGCCRDGCTCRWFHRHRPTAVQRKVLRWMKAADGQVTFDTGHKRTQLLAGDYDEQIVCCQTLVLHFLKAHGYVEQAGGIRRYMLTDKGKAAAR